MILDAGQIKRLLHGNNEWREWANPLRDLLPKYRIDTAKRIAMFVAQCAHESLNFKVLEENLNYSAKALNAVFPKYFQRAGRDAAMYHRNPPSIANVVYSNRMGNRDQSSGDGWLHRGRGVIQLTGCDNYTAFAAAINMPKDDVIAHMETKTGALDSACWFWDVNNLNKYADKSDVRGATKRINGGYNGLEDRQHHYDNALAVLGGQVPQAAPVLLKVGSTGQEVADIQRALALDPDGIFGLMTAMAVKEWQTENGLLPDGIVGPKTYAKII